MNFNDIIKFTELLDNQIKVFSFFPTVSQLPNIFVEKTTIVSRKFHSFLVVLVDDHQTVGAILLKLDQARKVRHVLIPK